MCTWVTWVYVGVRELCACTWVYVGVRGCAWVYAGVRGCTWVTWVYVGVHPHTPTYVGVHVYMGVSVCTWVTCVYVGYVGVRGSTWVYVGVRGLRGCTWVYVGIRGCVHECTRIVGLHRVWIQFWFTAAFCVLATFKVIPRETLTCNCVHSCVVFITVLFHCDTALLTP